MKDLIRMNQLAGTITEGQARKMIAILNETEDFKVRDLVFIKSNGQFETKPREVHQIYGDQYVVSGHIKSGDGEGYSTEGGKAVNREDVKLASEDPITESNIIDQDFKVLKNQQDILKKVSNFYREKAEELKIDRKLIGDFNAAINALEDAIFKADYNK
jgi:hypothetical protein